MRIWIKLLLGSIIGVALGLFLPLKEGATAQTFSVISDIVLNIGRWVLFPLVFFSVAAATHELRQDKHVLVVFGRIIAYLAASTAILVIFGTLSIVLLSPARIPIIDEQHVAFTLPSFISILHQLFPQNMFTIFSNDGNFLLPIYFLAFFIGLNFSFDRLITRPTYQLFDSLGRIFYHINSFVVELLAIGMIALSAYLLLGLRASPDLGLFTQLITVLVIDVAIIIFGLYPVLLFYLGERENPYRWLYATLAPAIAGFFSGNSYFSISVTIRHGKESLGVPRTVGAPAYPLAVLFGRAGTALVTAVSFVVILKSYSSLGISIGQVFWVMGASLLVSFLLGSVPGMGAFVALSLLCSSYGKGLEQGYLILKPVAPLLVSIGVLLDMVTASLVSLLVARHEGLQKEIEVKDYI
ncbi:MAG TPA: cation:dicarboxylase symporter family transporter [Spirochaetia bacterium]|nr:cation:dicarboxylase symporter family transporter [Spirochaetia bacterium]